MSTEPAIRVLVIGDVEWKNDALVHSDMDSLSKAHSRVFRLFTREPRGAEAFAVRYAREHGWSDTGAMTTGASHLSPRERAKIVVNNIKPHYVFVYLTARAPSRDTLAMVREATAYARLPSSHTCLLTSRRAMSSLTP